ncbi:MAG: four helix bundle protein [Fimbriimonadaceae bacterium]
MIQDLDVYKFSLTLAIDVYGLTAHFPKSEEFGLTSQMRRAATSIPCNLAEGAGRNNRKEFAHFVGISRGSCSELQTLVAIAEGVGCLEPSPRIRGEIDRVGRMLTQLRRSLSAKKELAS